MVFIGGVINGRKVVLASYKQYGNWRIAQRCKYGDLAWYYAPRGLETVTFAEELKRRRSRT